MVPRVEKLHHFAYRCRDAEETRRFYEDLLGLPLAFFISAEDVPSTGEHCPYAHIFFELGDGSYVAFFDLGDNKVSVPDPDTPSWVNHLALEVDDEDALMTHKARLESAGIEVVGPTDHGICRSIYFFDPNGIRLELTWRTMDEAEMAAHAASAREELAAWMARRKDFAAA